MIYMLKLPHQLEVQFGGFPKKSHNIEPEFVLESTSLELGPTFIAIDVRRMKLRYSAFNYPEFQRDLRGKSHCIWDLPTAASHVNCGQISFEDESEEEPGSSDSSDTTLEVGPNGVLPIEG